jgi:hypothetical protein
MCDFALVKMLNKNCRPSAYNWESEFLFLCDSLIGDCFFGVCFSTFILYFPPFLSIFILESKLMLYLITFTQPHAGSLNCLESASRSKSVGKHLLRLWVWSLWICTGPIICIQCLCRIWPVSPTGKHFDPQKIILLLLYHVFFPCWVVFYTMHNHFEPVVKFIPEIDKYIIMSIHI